jgi:translocation and assembly module TamB
VALPALDRPEFDLAVVAEDALLLADERGEVTGDADLRVTGDLDLIHVRGDLHVLEGEIQAPEPEGEQRATRLDDPALLGVYEGLGLAESLRPRGGLMSRLDLDVLVRIERDTWVRNSVMNVEVYTPEDAGALRVTTDPITHELLFEGVINADRGDYSFAGREFELTTGSVTFVGGLPDPLLQLSARHEVPRRGREALVILIAIGGTLAEPKLSLSSNVQPPIAESDLLSYLAFGRESGSLLMDEGSGIMGDALGGLGVLAEQQLAGLGLGALSQGIFSNLERRGTAAGLDVFRVRPNARPDELNFAGYQNVFESLQIEAGEYLNNELFLSAKAQPGAGGVPSLGLEWKRPDGFSWVTTWQHRFLPPVPALDVVDPRRTRAFATFLLWERRF